MVDYRKNRTEISRVALIVPVRAPLGEAEDALCLRHRYNLAQARALGRTGVRVELFIDAPFDGERAIDASGTVRFVSAPKVARSLVPPGAHLLAAALARSPDVIHVFHLLDVKTLAVAALSPVPVFAEYNGGAVPGAGLRKGAMRAATARLAGVFFTARPLAEPFVSAGAISKRAVVRAVPELSSLLPAAPARAEARARFGFREDELVVLSAGRLAREKDPATVLSAFTAIRSARGGNVRMIFAALKDREEEQLPGLPNVELRRDVPAEDMPALYAAADVMISASRRETCGAAFIEALQAGLPIAASDIPAFRALAGDSSAVRLCPLGQSAALAEAALALAADPRARDSAKVRFAAALSYEAIGARKLAIYRGQLTDADY